MADRATGVTFWWCWRCKWSYRCHTPASAIYCPKGHCTKRVNEADLPALASAQRRSK